MNVKVWFIFTLILDFLFKRTTQYCPNLNKNIFKEIKWINSAVTVTIIDKIEQYELERFQM